MMEHPLRVPPCIRFRFEEHAHEICRLAVLEYADESRVFTELVGRMVDQWRKYMSGDFITDDTAAAQVLEKIGSVKDVARVYRGGGGGFWHRLCFYQRYTLFRLICPVFIGAYHSWIIQTGSIKVSVLSPGNVNVAFTALPREQMVAVMMVLAIMILRRFLQGQNTPPAIGQFLGLMIVLSVLGSWSIDWLDASRSIFRDILAQSLSALDWLGAILIGSFVLLDAVGILLAFYLLWQEIIGISLHQRSNPQRPKIAWR